MSKPRTLDPPESTSRTAVPATQRFVPISYRPDDAAELIGLSVSKFYELVREWGYPGFVDGQRTWAGCGIRAAAWSSW